MTKKTNPTDLKRGRFKSGRIWKEPRMPAGSRTRSKALKTSWRTKMNQKATRDQAKRLERDMRQAALEVRRAERERIAARKKRKEANRLKDQLTNLKNKANPKMKRNRK